MAGMYGPNDVLGACGAERNGCFGVIVLLLCLSGFAGAGVFFAFC